MKRSTLVNPVKIMKGENVMGKKRFKKSCVTAMLMLAIFFSGMQTKIFAQAAGECNPNNHRWGNWQVVKVWSSYDPNADLDNFTEICIMRNVQWSRFCEICGASQNRYTATQLEHNWVRVDNNWEVCTNCGSERGDYIR